tara:strand:+ start:240 stop:410 length:171 start_codon:yes stop_codon:yes gene_type:complete
MTDQELERFMHNTNSYALSLERRIVDLEKHNRSFLTLYIAGVIMLVFTIAALILLA